MKNMTGSIGAVLNFFIVSCRPEEKWFERLKRRGIDEGRLMSGDVEEVMERDAV